MVILIISKFNYRKNAPTELNWLRIGSNGKFNEHG